jgi:hypothetical protein
MNVLKGCSHESGPAPFCSFLDEINSTGLKLGNILSEKTS